MNRSRIACILAVTAVLSVISGCKDFFEPRTDTPGGTAAKVAYVANFNAGSSGSLSILTLDSGTGALTSLTSASTGSSAQGNGPAAVITVSGKFVYSANDGGGVSGFTINSDGTLVAIANSPFQAGTNPTAVATNPSGKFLFVANSGSNDVDAYTIDGSTGALTPIAGSPFPDTANGAASGLAVLPNGNFLYLADDTAGIDVWSIASTGTLTFVGNTPAVSGGRPQAITFSPSGNFAYVADGVNSVDVYTVNTASGALAPLSGTNVFLAGPSGGQVSPIAITVDPSGSFVYTANRDGNSVSGFALLSSGALTPLSGSPYTVCSNSTTTCGASPTSLRVEPTGKFLYVTNFNSPGITIFSFDSASPGKLNQVGTAGAGTNPAGISFD